MRTSTICAEAAAFERAYPGTTSQDRLVRTDLAAVADGCPAVESLLLVEVEVEDQGGPWTAAEHDVERGRGLAIVAAVAGDGNWGIEDDTACRLAWSFARPSNPWR